MRKNKALWIGLVLCLLLHGCMPVSAGDGNRISPEQKQTGTAQEKEEKTDMDSITFWEKELLKKIYTSEDDAARIDSGELAGYQQGTLEQLRALDAYLAAKYPAGRFQVVSVELPLADTGVWTYQFVEGEEETLYKAVAASANPLAFRDDYYMHLLTPAYDDLLRERLQEAGLAVTALHTDFTALLGAEGPGEMSAEEALAAGAKLPRDTAVYLYGEDPAAVLEAAKPVILQAVPAVSSFRVYCSPQYVEGLRAEECAALWKTDRKAAKAISFSTGH